VAFHEFAHVQPDHRVFVVEQDFGQGLAQFGLADAGRTQEQERADRPLRILQSATAAADGVRDRLDGLVLADQALVNPILHHQQLGAFGLHHAADRDAGPGAHDLGDFFLRDLLPQQPPLGFRLDLAFLFRGLDALPQLTAFNVQFVQFLVLVFADRNAGRLLFLDGRVQLGESQLDLGGLLADFLDVAQAQLLRLPLLAQAGLLAFQLGDLLLDFREPVLGGLLGLFGQLARGQLQLPQPPLDFIDRRRDAFQLHGQTAGRFVHQVDGLVGQEPIADVAVREFRRRHQRRILDLDAVVRFVARFETAQDGDRVLDRRLADVHRLKATLQRGVLFDVLAVLVQGRSADAAQFAAGQRGLEQIRGVGAALGASGADHRVQFVDEHDHVAAGVLHFPEHGLQPVLEFAAELGAGDHRAHVQGDDPFVLQALGHVALHDAQRQAFGDRRLAHAGLADQHGVVLGAAGQHLDHAADFAVAADHRIQLALAGALHQVDAIPLQSLELVLRALVRHSAAAADRAQGGQHVGLADAVDLQQVLRFAGRLGQRQQQMLRRDKVVLHGLGFARAGLQNLLQRLIRRRRSAAGDFRQAR